MKRRDLITLLGGTDVSPTAALAQFTLKNNDAGATDTVEKLGSGKDKMSDLLGLVISAHGGAEQWNQLSRVSAHVRGGGLLWTVKGEEGVFGDRTVNAELHYQWLSYSPFRTPELSTGYMPDRVAIIRADGSTVQERCEPRASFAGHQRETLWDDLQAIYFSSYAMWNYLTEPFLLTYPGVKTQEIEPWNEEGERWRRLKAQFPPKSLPTPQNKFSVMTSMASLSATTIQLRSAGTPLVLNMSTTTRNLMELSCPRSDESFHVCPTGSRCANASSSPSISIR